MIYDDLTRFKRIFRRLPSLETDRLCLRKAVLRDAQDIYRYAQDAEVARYVLWTPHHSLADSREMVRSMRMQYRRGYPSSWVIALKESGRVIGTIGYMWISPGNLSAEVGYSLARDCWNQGLMTEALRAVLAFSFDTLSLHRVEAQHDIRNPASGRVMEKAGMQAEGVLRDRLINKGAYSTVKLYAAISEQHNTAK